MKAFLKQVQKFQWDDHRYYHQSRINQTLHLVSACSFLVAYGLLFVDPAAAGIVGWVMGMVTRQSGHIFFEPRSFDAVNGVTDAYKETIKVGYNMRRKAILIGVWLGLPLVLLLWPSVFGLIEPAQDAGSYWHDVGLAWLGLGVGGVVLRFVYLFSVRGPAFGLAWAVKIVLDPFHNVAIYWLSPWALMKGELLDPITSRCQQVMDK